NGLAALPPQGRCAPLSRLGFQHNPTWAGSPKRRVIALPSPGLKLFGSKKTEFCLGPFWFWKFSLAVSAHASRLHCGWPGAYRSLVTLAYYVKLASNRPTSGWPVMLPQWATANRVRQGALTQSLTTIARDPFYREWLCGAGQGCRRRITERLYVDNCLPLTVELFHQLAFSF